MYPQCRHVHPDGGACQSPSLTKSHWCYFHTRFHQRQTEHRARLQASRTPRLANGRFALPEEAGQRTIDYGLYPVGAAHDGTAEQPPAFDLPPIEDAASIQLALIDVLQALAANQLDPKRAGLLLYGLQVASANARNVKTSTHNAVRDLTESEDGTPLAPQQYGRDWEDYDDEEEDAEECEDEEDDG